MEEGRCKCGAPLVNIRLGAICSGGCGKVFSKLDPETNWKNTEEIRKSQLPVAQELPICDTTVRPEYWGKGLYSIAGKMGLWSLVTKAAGKADPTAVHAQLDGGDAWLAPRADLNQLEVLFKEEDQPCE